LINNSPSQNVLLGTYTAGSDEKEFLQIGTIQLPTGDETSPLDTQIKITKQFSHNREVNRARYMSQTPKIVATASVSGDVYLYDIDSENTGPLETLKYHTKNGYGIAWNAAKEGRLATCSDDATIAVWDISSTEQPQTILSTHADIVNDIDWHASSEFVLGSVSDDKSLLIHDLRSSGPVLRVEQAHDDAVNSLSFSPFSKYLLASVSADNAVALWDTRNLSRRLHSLLGHCNSITSVQWSPHTDGVLASAGTDRRVIIWDISRVGEEQMPEDAEDGPPELLFMHGGHTSSVTDFGWNPDQEWLLGSVSEDNICQAWRPAQLITLGTTDVVVNDAELE
jgi:histone-binding protein RBBP4